MKHKVILLILLLTMLYHFNSIPIGVKSLEHEAIDSFGTHPANRYITALTSSDETLTVNNGILNYTDVGDALESSARTRQLSKKDGKIEGRLNTPLIYNDSTPNELRTSLDIPEEYVGYNFSQYDGDTIIDMQNLINGTLINNPQINQTGKSGVNSAIYFNGSLTEFSYIEISDSDELSFTDGSGNDEAFSLSLWVNFSHIHTTVNFLEKSNEYAFYGINSTIAVSGYVFAIGFNLIGQNGQSLICLHQSLTTNYFADNTFHHLTFTYDGTNTKEGMNIWIDSINRTTHRLNTGGGYNYMQNTSNDVYIGKTTGIGAPTYQNFTMDEFRLFTEDSGYTGDDTFTGELSHAQASHYYYEFDYIDSLNCSMMFGLENVDTTLNLNSPAFAILFNGYTDRPYRDLQVEYGLYDGTNFKKVAAFNVSRGIWLRFKIDFDVLRSEIEIEFLYDNSTDITNSELSYLDITTNNVDLFSADVLDVFYGNRFVTSGIIQTQYDFLHAPFEEFQFSTTDVAAPAIIPSYNEFGITAELPQVPSSSKVSYDLVVPEFDSCSGILYASSNHSSETVIDEASMISSVRIMGVNQSTGVLTQMGALTLGFSGKDDSGTNDKTFADPRVRFTTTGTWYSGPYNLSNQIDSTEFENTVECGFNFYRNPSNILIMQTTFSGLTYTFERNMSDYSQEIVIRLGYYASRLTETETQNGTFLLGCKEFEMVQRDLFGFLQAIPNPLNVVEDVVDTASNVGNDIGGFLMQGFRFIGDIFSTVLDPIVSTVSSILTLLGSVIGTLGSILSDSSSMVLSFSSLLTDTSNIFSKIGEIFTTLTTDIFNAIEDLPTFLQDIFDGITDLASTIWTAIIDEIANIFDEILTWINANLAPIIDMFFDLLFGVWDDILASTFIGDFVTFLGKAWDILTQLVISLEALADLGLDTITFATEYAFAMYLVATLLIFLAITNPRDIFSNLAVDISGGTTIIGERVYIPLGAAWLLLTIFWWALYGS